MLQVGGGHWLLAALLDGLVKWAAFASSRPPTYVAGHLLSEALDGFLLVITWQDDVDVCYLFRHINYHRFPLGVRSHSLNSVLPSHARQFSSPKWDRKE